MSWALFTGPTCSTTAFMIQRRNLVLTAWLTMGGLRMAHSAKDTQGALLTVGGRIGKVNDEATKTYRFTEEEFLALPQSSITTATTWTPRSKFEGPKLIDVMRAVDGAAGSRLKFTTIDDYSASIPWDDLARYGVSFLLWGLLDHIVDGHFEAVQSLDTEIEGLEEREVLLEARGDARLAHREEEVQQHWAP